MLVACDKHIAVLEFAGNKMMQIASIRNVHDNEITDFILRGNHMYSTAFNEPLIKATRFGDPVIGGTTVVTNNAPLSGSPYTNFGTSKTPHPALLGLEKVVATPDAGTVYTGGKGLHVFKRTGTGAGFAPVDVDPNRGKLISLFIFMTN